MTDFLGHLRSRKIHSFATCGHQFILIKVEKSHATLRMSFSLTYTSKLSCTVALVIVGVLNLKVILSSAEADKKVATLSRVFGDLLMSRFELSVSFITFGLKYPLLQIL